ncbi:MAG: hypothetical protein AB4368_25205 [Xenococcaceae cyanobacterium]
MQKFSDRVKEKRSREKSELTIASEKEQKINDQAIQVSRYHSKTIPIINNNPIPANKR